MSPEEIRLFLASHPDFKHLRVSDREPLGYSFWLDVGGRSTRVFYANRSSAHATTLIRLPISMRLRLTAYNQTWLRLVPDKKPHYYAFTGGRTELEQLVAEELRLYPQV